MIWAGFTVALVWAWVVAPIRESTDAIPWLMKAPLIALYLMWPLWQGGRFVLQKMREAPLAVWQGRYYAFGNFQIRVLVDEDDRLLIVATGRAYPGNCGPRWSPHSAGDGAIGFHRDGHAGVAGAQLAPRRRTLRAVVAHAGQRAASSYAGAWDGQLECGVSSNQA